MSERRPVARWVSAPSATIKAVEPDDEGRPPVTAAALTLENGLTRAVREAWRDVAARVDDAALLEACRRRAVMDIERHLQAGLAGELIRQAVEPRIMTAFGRAVDHETKVLRAMGVSVRERKALDVDLSAANEAAGRWARLHSADLITAIRQHQRDAVRELVEEANASEGGITPQELARRVREIVGLRPDQVRAVRRFRQRLQDAHVPPADVARRSTRYAESQRRSRARTIARTELIFAASGGQQMVWEEAVRSGQLSARRMGKVWIVTDDERLEAQCEALDGVVVPIREDFVPGVKHPPLHPNCRCSMGLVGIDADGRPAALFGQGGRRRRRGGTPPAEPGPRQVSDRFIRHVLDWTQAGEDGFWDEIGTIAEEFGIYRGAMQDGTLDQLVNAGEVVVNEDTAIEMVTGIVADIMGVRNKIKHVYSFQPEMELQGVHASWDERTGTVRYSSGASLNIIELLERILEPDLPGPGPLRQPTPNRLGRSLETLGTIFHELLHAKSAHEYNIKNYGAYADVNDMFIEEGIVEMRARRYAATTLLGGLGKTRPRSIPGDYSFRLIGGQTVAEGWSWSAYGDYVREMRWFERIFGAFSVDTLLSTKSVSGRKYYMAYGLRAWAHDAFHGHPEEQVRRDAPYILEALEAASDDELVTGLRAGFFRELNDDTPTHIFHFLARMTGKYDPPWRRAPRYDGPPR